jgi:hypothetical protein
LTEEEKEFINQGKNFYEIKFTNKGGLVMPLILKFDFLDGSSEEYRIPAEVWLLQNQEASKIFSLDKEVVQITLDPYLETADVDMSNNYFPSKQPMNRFELFRSRQGGAPSEEKPHAAGQARTQNQWLELKRTRGRPLP